MLINITQMCINTLQSPKSYTEFFCIDGFAFWLWSSNWTYLIYTYIVHEFTMNYLSSKDPTLTGMAVPFLLVVPT